MNLFYLSCKALNIVDAGFKIAQVMNDKDATKADKAAAILQGIFIGAEIGNITVANVPGVSSGVRFGMSVAAGGADVGRFAARTYSHKVKRGEKWTTRDTIITTLEGTSSVLFRLGDIMEIAQFLSLSPEHMRLCQQLSSYANVGRSVGALGTTIVQFQENAGILRRAVQEYFSTRRRRQATCSSPGIELERKMSAEERRQGHSSEQDCADVQLLLRYAAHIDRLPEIPTLIADDSDFMHHCPITGKPIRFILVPNLPEHQREGDILDIVYERAAIEEWIKNTPDLAPPHWPVELLPLPLKNGSLMVDARRQANINKALKKCIQNIQLAYLREQSKQR